MPVISVIAFENGKPSFRMPSKPNMKFLSGKSKQPEEEGGINMASKPPVASRSISLASISSEGSGDTHVVDQDDVVFLTQDVRRFKEALGKLRRIFHPDRDKHESRRVAAHERLGEVLEVLRSILKKFPHLQSTELFMAAGALIQQVKGFRYEDEKQDTKEFCDTIDQLAVAFSSRVSEYLMGDLDSSSSVSLNITKSKSTENLHTEVDAESMLTPEQMDSMLIKMSEGVEHALNRAKIWGKYAKDIFTYIERRSTLEMDYARNLSKLAQTVRPTLNDESFLPFQSIYCTALDQDMDNCNNIQATCNLLLGHKFLEPLSARRSEHDKSRRQLKETWIKECRRMQDSVNSLRKAKQLYHQRQQDHIKAKETATKVQIDSTDSAKVDKKRKQEDDALQKAIEAETTYKACVAEANERHQQVLRVKADLLKSVRELMLQCDQTMKAVTVSYFQLQHGASAPLPVQFQTLCESSRLYEPGSQYMEFVRRLPVSTGNMDKDCTNPMPFTFEAFTETSSFEKDRKSTISIDSETGAEQRPGPVKAWSSGNGYQGSDTDSISSCHSNTETSPSASPKTRRLHTQSDDYETGYSPPRPHCAMSKAADTHNLKRLKTPSRCRECDSYVYFQGAECSECGLACHKKCLATLAIQCGHKRLPRKMTTFGVDLQQHVEESNTSIPHLAVKCIHEIDKRGCKIKGLYRVSGVKSRVEKLCQIFENGADLVDLSDSHPNVIANVLKLYLRQLPEPLLKFKLYNDFIRIAKEHPSNTEDSSKKVVEQLRESCSRLPKAYYHTLAFLMRHLQRVASFHEHNNMPAYNLGIVFGPTLLRTAEGSASLSSLVDTVHQTRAVELMIVYAEQIFPESEIPLPASQPIKQTDSHSTSTSTTSSGNGILSKVPLVRSFSTATVGRKKDTDLVSTQTQSRPVEEKADVTLPGYLQPETKELSDSDLTPSCDPLGTTSDIDEEDVTLPDDSIAKKSPLMPHHPHQALRKTVSDFGGKISHQADKLFTKAASAGDFTSKLPPLRTVEKSDKSKLAASVVVNQKTQASTDSSIDSDYSYDSELSKPETPSKVSKHQASKDSGYFPVKAQSSVEDLASSESGHDSTEEINRIHRASLPFNSSNGPYSNSKSLSRNDGYYARVGKEKRHSVDENRVKIQVPGAGNGKYSPSDVSRTVN